MRFGDWDVETCIAGRFRLDGGAMFGVVPKTMWEQLLPPDEFNRVPMVMRILLVRGHGRTIVVDVGAGGGHSEKHRQIYAFEDTEHLADVVRAHGVEPAQVTDVLLTHLHFDHGAGIVEPDGEDWRLIFSKALHHVQRTQWQHAWAPNPRDRASYYGERLRVMEREGLLRLYDGPWSLAPGFDLVVVDGHTPGQQLPVIGAEPGTVFFCGDLFPTHHHLPTPYVMSYDLFPVTVMDEKVSILERAVAGQWVLCFEHDAQIEACRIQKDGKRFVMGEGISI